MMPLTFSGMPFYWRNETSGQLKQIIVKFLNREPFNQWELETFRWYVHQWVAAMPSKPEDYNKIMLMSQTELFEYIPGELLGYGIDPL